MSVASTARDDARSAIAIARFDRFLVARFDAPHDAVSWAIARGGFVTTRAVAWCEVRDDELRPPVDARRFLAARLDAIGQREAIGLLTSRHLDTYEVVDREEQDARATCVATVGMGNALRAGDPAGIAGRIGTINLLCRASSPLTHEALLEAMAVATEAKTAAVLESGIVSRRTARPATGTGTDCVVVAAPCGDRRAAYAGKHTAIGAAIGGAAYEAVARGVRAWLRERAARGDA